MSIQNSPPPASKTDKDAEQTPYEKPAIIYRGHLKQFAGSIRSIIPEDPLNIFNLWG